jgi:exodeoxyribonuclease V alpha subunit
MSRDKPFQPAPSIARGSVTESFDETTDPWLKMLIANTADQNVDPALIELSWSFALLDPDLDRELRHVVCAISLICLQGHREGNVRIPLEADEFTTIDHRLDSWQLPGIRSELCRMIDERRAPSLIGESGEHKPIIAADGWLYLHRNFRRARSLEHHLRARLQAPNPIWPDEAIRAALDDILQRYPSSTAGLPTALDAWQVYGLLTAAHSNFTVITGGPGTGKTSVIVSLLRLLLRLGLQADDIALAAPTGKAAKRMEASIGHGLRSIADLPEIDRRLLGAGPTPQTLHRLLEYSPGQRRFLRDHEAPISARFVIVDEASMIDLALMDRLFAATHPEASLVLLGDDQQLPSVDAGAILRDLVEVAPSTETPWQKWVPEIKPLTGTDPMSTRVVALQKNFRVANKDDSSLSSTATTIAWIRGPKTDAELEDLTSQMRFVDEANQLQIEGFEVFELRDQEMGPQLHAFLTLWFSRFYVDTGLIDRIIDHRWTWSDGAMDKNDELFLRDVLDQLDAIRILCATRVGRAGSQAINALCHRWIADRQPGLDPGASFAPGQSVIMTRNDYSRELFNGDQGLVVDMEVDGLVTPRVVFLATDRPKIFRLSTLVGSLERSFALTVHKAQGSEFNHVAVVLPDRDLPMWGHEMFYTAVTRSKSSVTVVGTRDRLISGLQTRERRFASGIDLETRGTDHIKTGRPHH